MSKAFTKETNNEEELQEPDPLPAGVKNLMTPAGHKMLRDELEFLLSKERPRIVEIVSWAAGNGDRSENGDYLYNKKRLREIDRRVRYLTKKLDKPEIVDPKKQQALEQVFFGATVKYARTDGTELTVKLVGIDEANMDEGKINWVSPVGRALLKARVGDVVEVRTEEGSEPLEILSIDYIID
ncbi:MAG: transcription elongation factor GreB [Micavibrio sp.]|nr:transcription elongation factor GreB [Micavibrio sp.]MBK9561889.1 transcription elongation factor GreB [Micavibrio sp.]